MKFEDYYKEFCQVFGHPLWHMPMMFIGLFLMIEVMHIREHYNMENGDAHGYCGQTVPAAILISLYIKFFTPIDKYK